MRGLWTPAQLAEFLGVSLKTVYRWTARCQIPHLLLNAGKRRETIRYRPAAIESWLTERERAATNGPTRWSLR